MNVLYLIIGVTVFFASISSGLFIFLMETSKKGVENLSAENALHYPKLILLFNGIKGFTQLWLVISILIAYAPLTNKEGLIMLLCLGVIYYGFKMTKELKLASANKTL